MRFKSQSKSAEMPEVNLVPMMDVLMTILTFFIIIAMTMSNVRSLDLRLPGGQSGGAQSAVPPSALRIGLTAKGQFLVDNQPVNGDDLKQRMQSYLAQNPQGVVLLSADRTLPYEQVVQVLGDLEAIGGDRISLALEQ
jgi:biopolymer transport protein ExbD